MVSPDAAHPQPNFDMTPTHKDWLDDINATMRLQPEALQAWAAQLRSPIDENPRVYVSGLGPLPQDSSNVMVDWPTPRLPYIVPEHQESLTKALGVSLLTIRQKAQRRVTNMWGGLAFFGGAIMSGVSETVVKNEAVSTGGWVLAGLGGIALAWANTRNKPDGSSLEEPEQAPILLEQLPDDPVA